MGENHLEAEISGDYKFVKESSSEDSTLYIKDVIITGTDSLMAQYKDDQGQDKFRVQYGNWGISYEIFYEPEDPERNIGFISDFTETTITMLNEEFEQYKVKAIIDPIPDSYPDNQDYILNGSFRINDSSHSYSLYEFECRQLDLDQPEKYITLEGILSIPSLNGYTVGILTPGAEIDNLFSIEDPSDLPDDVITRNTDGIWTSGEMTITSENSVVVEFNEDGSASFDNGWDPVPDWQDELDPIED